MNKKCALRWFALLLVMMLAVVCLTGCAGSNSSISPNATTNETDISKNKVDNNNKADRNRERECDRCYGSGECSHCDGRGGEWCANCLGSGDCWECDGEGYTETYAYGRMKCTYCNRTGECHWCDGEGEIECNYCDGDGDCFACDGKGTR